MSKIVFIRLLLIFFFLLLVSEFILRFYFGFCDAVLMERNSKYEYIAQPNQNRFRFRKHIKYNNYSMRSDRIRKEAFIILGFGDSVLNGGSLTDQDSLATEILTRKLSSLFKIDVQVLNISAGSWGPDNCSAYLKEKGNFGAKMFFLVASSHDAFDNMNFEELIGKNKDFPTKQYGFALYELFDRYIFPVFFSSNSTKNKLGINISNEKFNPGFFELKRYADEKNIPFFIYLHAQKDELIKGKFNQKGLKIIDFCKKNNIQLINEMDLLSADCFRDEIHLNEKGQRVMSQLLCHPIVDFMIKIRKIE